MKTEFLILSLLGICASCSSIPRFRGPAQLKEPDASISEIHFYLGDVFPKELPNVADADKRDGFLDDIEMALEDLQKCKQAYPPAASTEELKKKYLAAIDDMEQKVYGLRSVVKKGDFQWAAAEVYKLQDLEKEKLSVFFPTIIGPLAPAAPQAGLFDFLKTEVSEKPDLSELMDDMDAIMNLLGEEHVGEVLKSADHSLPGKLADRLNRDFRLGGEMSKDHSDSKVWGSLFKRLGTEGERLKKALLAGDKSMIAFSVNALSVIEQEGHDRFD